VEAEKELLIAAKDQTIIDKDKQIAEKDNIILKQRLTIAKLTAQLNALRQGLPEPNVNDALANGA